MSRRRQRRNTLPAEPPTSLEAPEPSRRRSSHALSWNRTISTPRLRRSEKRRASFSPGHHVEEVVHREAGKVPYVSVRVSDFVAVPARLGEPRDALGPVDVVMRPPSYDLRGGNKGWDAEAVDRILDMESASEISLSEGESSTRVYVIDDPRYNEELLSIVRGRDDSHRKIVEDHASEASSSLLSGASTVETYGRASSVVSAECTAGLSNSRSASTTRTDPPSVLVAMKEVRKRPCLLPKKVPSPVKYTFRPPVRPISPVSSQVKDRNLGVEGTTVLPVILPERSRIREGSTLSAASSGPASCEPATLQCVKAAVDSIDPKVVLGMANPGMGLGLFKWGAKRDSDESWKSTETEYYEDEYTKFIERKSLSPLKLRSHPYWAKVLPNDGWNLKGAKMECRSNSTVSVSTSDEEFAPGEEGKRPSKT